MPIYLIVLICLATHRVTRFITRDKFPLMCIPREAFALRWAVAADAKTRADRRISITARPTNPLMSSLAYLWECDWCTSIWVGASLTFLTYEWTYTLMWILVALSASTVTGLIAQREPE